MIPKLLKVKGLYAYQETQEVDFETLISGGLFGIFGAVGSGKSSILEAIMFVLYGETGRLKKSENRLYNMMNLQSQELMIDFSFYAGKNHQQLFRAFYRAQRNKKDFTKVESKERAYYAWEADTWLPLPDKDATELIGMSYHHFKQTIIIPQGKFRDFVELKAADRSGMMKELFQLEQFDLYDKTSRLYKKSDAELNHINGQLTVFDRLDESGMEQLEATLRQHKTDLSELKEACEASAKRFQQQDTLAKLHQEFQKLQADKESHLSKADTVKSLQGKLEQYRSVNRHFKSDLENWQAYQEEVKEITADLQQNHTKIASLKPALQEAEKGYLNAKDEYFKKDIRLQQIADLENVHKLLEILRDLEKTLQALNIEKAKAESQSQQLKAITAENKSSKERLQQLEAALPDLVALSLQEARWQQAASEKEKVTTLSKQVLEYNKALKKNHEQLMEISRHFQPFEDFDQLTNAIENELIKKEQAIRLVREEKDKLSVKAALHQYAQDLHDDEPCPLCGALEHPTILQEEDANTQLQQSEETLKQFEKDSQGIRQELKKTEELLLSKKHLEEKITDVNNNLSSFQKIADDSSNLPDIADIQRKIAHGRQMQADITKLKAQINVQEKALLSDSEKLELALSAQQKLTLQYEKLEGIRQNITDSVKTKTLLENLQETSPAQIQLRIEKGKTYVQQLEDNFNKAEGLVNSLKTAQTSALATKESLESQLKKYEGLEKTIQAKIAAALGVYGFSSMQEVLEILAEDMDEDKEEAFIKSFYDRLHIIEDRLKNLLKDENLQSFSTEQYEEAREAQQKASENQRNCEKNIALLEREVMTISTQLKAKKALNKQKDGLEKRLENLKKLLSLFTGKGFVNYISSIFLEELCHTANRRFSKLSQNNLSMALDENNNFIVADHLNGGKKRLLKTLSGGQIFQAALCLALALAEKVKSLNQAEQSFFFLDEGFGALDSNSLRIVFETLKSLKEENRIVGIISHVEALQQEIDIYAQILLEKENGSQVRYSWQLPA